MYSNALIGITSSSPIIKNNNAALYKGLAPNILRGMSMNVGMLACYDQAKETVGKLLGDPMEGGPRLTTQIGASCVAVSFMTSCCSMFACIYKYMSY